METLRSVTTICTDKTGTLTQNRMTVTEVLVPGEQFELSALNIARELGITDNDHVLSGPELNKMNQGELADHEWLLKGINETLNELAQQRKG